jgi:hypothetical protein
MKIFMLIALCLGFSLVKAQTVKEWTQQKKTQIEYLLQQIAAQQIYLGYLKKGYTIVQKGSGLIRAVKDGRFQLDKAHFDGLININPTVARLVEAAATLKLAETI